MKATVARPHTGWAALPITAQVTRMTAAASVARAAAVTQGSWRRSTPRERRNRSSSDLGRASSP